MKIIRNAVLGLISAIIAFLPIFAAAEGMFDVTYNDGTLFVTMNSDEANSAYFFMNTVADDGTKSIVKVDEVPLCADDFVYIELIDAETAKKTFVGAAYKGSLKPISRHFNVAEAENARKLYAAESETVKKINAEISESLTKASESLGRILYNFDSIDDWDIICTVMDVFDDAVKKNDEFIINKDSIRGRYRADIDAVKNAYNAKNEDEKKSFKTKLSGVDPDSFEFIVDFFDINTDNYEKG